MDGSKTDVCTYKRHRNREGQRQTEVVHRVTCSLANCNKTSLSCIQWSVQSFPSLHAMQMWNVKTRSGQTCHIQILHVLLILLLAAGTRQRQIACRIINLHACCFYRCSYIGWIIVTLLLMLLLLGLRRTSFAKQVNVWMLCCLEWCQATTHTVVKKQLGYSTDAHRRNMLTVVFSVSVSHSLDRNMSYIHTKIPLNYT